MAKNKITLNVLADITKKINNGTISNSNKKVLVVFTGSNIQLNEKIGELKKLKENDLEISLAFSFMAERILDTNSIINSLDPFEVYREEDIFDLEDIVEEYFCVIGPNITMNTLSKVSLGMIDSFVSNIIWTFLYMDKKVYLDFTSVNNYLGKKSKNKEINNIIENHISTLNKMGAIGLEEGKYMEKIVQGKPNIKGPEIPGKSMVITERDLANYSPKDQPIVLPKGSIITPLAKDRARELGIKIEIER